ncbi:hypothetical protein [Shimia sp. MIT1388]|uniref:hypothetical protein n=1 Tax=Shimia sp. MIT1388 TaxID=3096992 RepID=UPI00399BD54A
MKNLVLFAAAALGLAACVSPPTPEERAEQTSRNLPLAEAVIPSCIDAARGKQPNYSRVNALGYVQYEPSRKAPAGTYFKLPNQALAFEKASLYFAPGKGCSVYYSNEQDDFNVIGTTWVGALEAAGYKFTSKTDGNFDFVANGIPMRLTGEHEISNYANTMTFDIQRRSR